jgi:hypothetical protein
MPTAAHRGWRFQLAATKNATGSAKVTTDHDEIREWVESHGGHPAMVKRTARNGRGGILRIDFPGFSGEGSLAEVSWDDFFEKFEDSQLAFLYQERTASGRPSRFNKLVARESVQGRAAARAASTRTARSGAKPARRSPARSTKTTKKRPAPRASAASTRSKRTATKKTRGSSGRGSSARGASSRSRATKKKAAGSRRATSANAH